MEMAMKKACLQMEHFGSALFPLSLLILEINAMVSIQNMLLEDLDAIVSAL